MADDEQGERSEQATDARREEFRKRGQVAHTRELGGALMLLVAAMSVYMLGRFFFSNLYDLFSHTLGPDLVQTIRQGDYSDILKFTGAKAIFLIFPVVGAATLLGVASSFIQTGFLQVEDAMMPDINKINPLEGFKRIFSLRGLVEWLKSLLKLTGISVVLYFLLKSEVKQVPFLMTFSVEQILVYVGGVIFKLFFAIGLISLGLALADYFFQRWDLERKMMMTKQEIKEEVKQREGDPMIKARIRRVQRDVANKRMMEKVPKADVIVTNPTHIAIALRYGADLPAPQVIAKGADLVAERIKAIAREHNIPIVENKPLARTIYKTLKLGQVIPRELFVAVAEVLSYVFKLKKKKVGRL
jgi:flagellar biosynthetic protein FlhB